MKNDNAKLYWTIAYWILLAGWILGAALNMARVHGGFLTNYLADLSFPAWFYIFIRGLSTAKKKLPQLVLFGNWFGQSPERAAIAIFLFGAVTEILTPYLPYNVRTGTYDLLDIVAYGAGLFVCYFFDKLPSVEKRNQP